MDFKKLKQLAKEIKDSAGKVDKKQLEGMAKTAQSLLASKVGNMDFSSIEKISYYTKAALSSNPGEIDYSKKEVKKLRSANQKSPDEFYKNALNGEKQFILFGDTNHTDTDLHEFFYGKENRERLVEMGVKHVFIEVEPEYQDIIDNCASGKFDTDEFIKAMQERGKKLNPNTPKIKNNPIAKQRLAVMRNQSKALKYWYKNGIKTHCPDDRSNLKSGMHLIEKSYAFMFNALNYAKECGTEKPIVTQRIIISYLFNSVARKDNSNRKPKYPSNEVKMGNPEDFKNFMAKRMADDVKLAKTISNAANGEPAVILFGSGHGDRKNGLADLIGENKIVRVNLHSLIEHYAEKSSVFQREDNPSRSDPDFIHILKDNKVYQSEGVKSYDGFQVKPVRFKP